MSQRQLMQLSDALLERQKQGHSWPKRQTVYLWQFNNFRGFRKCTKKLGSKLLLDLAAFEKWLLEACEEESDV